MVKNPIQFKQKEYKESDQRLARDVKEFAAMAVRAVSFNGSGGFPAKQPERGAAANKK